MKPNLSCGMIIQESREPWSEVRDELPEPPAPEFTLLVVS